MTLWSDALAVTQAALDTVTAAVIADLTTAAAGYTPSVLRDRGMYDLTDALEKAVKKSLASHGAELRALKEAVVAWRSLGG